MAKSDRASVRACVVQNVTGSSRVVPDAFYQYHLPCTECKVHSFSLCRSSPYYEESTYRRSTIEDQ